MGLNHLYHITMIGVVYQQIDMQNMKIGREIWIFAWEIRSNRNIQHNPQPDVEPYSMAVFSNPNPSTKDNKNHQQIWSEMVEKIKKIMYLSHHSHKEKQQDKDDEIVNALQQRIWVVCFHASYCFMFCGGIGIFSTTNGVPFVGNPNFSYAVSLF